MKGKKRIARNRFSYLCIYLYVWNIVRFWYGMFHYSTAMLADLQSVRGGIVSLCYV